MLSFGLKEAKRAEVFAKTNEQKETVLAVVSMMNIPITVQKQAAKKARKLEARIGTSNRVVTKLQKKKEKAESEVTKQVEEKLAIAETSVNWSL